MHNSVLEHFITAKQGGQSALSAPDHSIHFFDFS